LTTDDLIHSEERKRLLAALLHMPPDKTTLAAFDRRRGRGAYPDWNRRYL
jgi:hypothetical protein